MQTTRREKIVGPCIRRSATGRTVYVRATLRNLNFPAQNCGVRAIMTTVRGRRAGWRTTGLKTAIEVTHSETALFRQNASGGQLDRNENFPEICPSRKFRLPIEHCMSISLYASPRV